MKKIIFFAAILILALSLMPVNALTSKATTEFNINPEKNINESQTSLFISPTTFVIIALLIILFAITFFLIKKKLSKPARKEIKTSKTRKTKEKD